MTDAAFSPTERSTILGSRAADLMIAKRFTRFTNIEAWENSEPAFGGGQRGAGSSQASGEEVQL